MYDTVLVPTDGSDRATAAARHGLALARRFGATVHVLSVVDLNRAAGPFDAGGVDSAFRERLADEARAAVASVSDLAEGIDLETATAEGRPAPAVLEYVDEHDADLVVMGTHGRGGLRRFVLGSVAEAVVRRSPVPVVTARGSDDAPDAAVDGYDSVLVPTDGSDCAGAAVEHAVAVAERFDATVHALGVVDTSVIAGRSEVTPADAVLGDLRESATDATDTLQRRASDAGVDAVTAVRDGYPASAILDYIDSEGIDFVAMGTHGRSGVERFLLGSTAERVVRNASVPVLTTRLRGAE